jgi:hypothetical protein
VVYLGVVYGTKAALDRMLPRDRGVIVQVGSALPHRGIPLQSVYCGSKHAIQGFTEAVRCELLHDRSNVRLTIVEMPALNTLQFEWVESRLPKKPMPVPPIYEPEVAAEAIVWAANHDRRQLWVGGSTVATIMANKVIPGLLDRYLGRTGYDSQQTDQVTDPSRPIEPVGAGPGRPGRPRCLRRSGARSQPTAMGHHEPAQARSRAGRRGPARRPVGEANPRTARA